MTKKIDSKKKSLYEQVKKLMKRLKDMDPQYDLNGSKNIWIVKPICIVFSDHRSESWPRHKMLYKTTLNPRQYSQQGPTICSAKIYIKPTNNPQQEIRYPPVGTHRRLQSGQGVVLLIMLSEILCGGVLNGQCFKQICASH